MLQMRVISLLINCMLFIYIVSSHLMSHCGRNCMVFEFTTTCAIKPITSKVVSANPSWRGVLNTTLCDKVCQ
jgi:hypothetical protein